MAQNHYVTKTKRRQKSGKRNDKDTAAQTMAKLRARAAAEAKSAGK